MDTRWLSVWSPGFRRQNAACRRSRMILAALSMDSLPAKAGIACAELMRPAPAAMVDEQQSGQAQKRVSGWLRGRCNGRDVLIGRNLLSRVQIGQKKCPAQAGICGVRGAEQGPIAHTHEGIPARARTLCFQDEVVEIAEVARNGTLSQASANCKRQNNKNT